MSDNPPLVDIHCHILPEIDDGSTGWDETLRMAELAVADGIAVIIATPHQLGNYSQNHPARIYEEVAHLQQRLQQRGIALRVLPGADVRIEPGLIRRILDGEVLTLGDHHRHVLLELPHELYLPLEQLVGEFRAAEVVPILSHPERNAGILARREVVAPLVEAGCLMQVTAGALIGTFGPQVRELAEWLVHQRLVHFIATDAHGAKQRRPLMRRAFEAAARLVGLTQAAELCCHNPARVAEGRDVSAARCHSACSVLPGWLWRKRAA